MMASLPLIRTCCLSPVYTSLLQSARTFHTAYQYKTHQKLLSSAVLCHNAIPSTQKARTCKSVVSFLHLSKHYHAGLQNKLLENVSPIDLDVEDAEPSTEEEMVNASEVLRNLGPQDVKKLKMIQLEFDVHKEMSGKVPETMTDEDWLHVFRLDSKSKRISYYNFLFKKEKMKQNKKQKQATRQQQRQQEDAELTALQEQRRQEPGKNTLFMFVRETTMTKVANNRLAHAMVFGQPLVFDMDYEQYMRPRDCRNLVDQLKETYAKNRSHMNPFHMIFTSLNPHGLVFSTMRRQFLTGQHFLGTMTDKSYLDLFPKERLVYLTPHTNCELKQVNYDDVYIVGGFNDKACNKPVSLARAKEQGIRTAKFPLDSYLLWGTASKSLTLDQVIAILLEQRESNDWLKAFEAVPRRKLKRDFL